MAEVDELTLWFVFFPFLQTLIGDFLTVTEFSTEYRRRLKERGTLSADVEDFGVLPLTSSCWPLKIMPQFETTVLPPVMERCQRDFSTYWSHKTANAKTVNGEVPSHPYRKQYHV
jgi:hypothetical protein